MIPAVQEVIPQRYPFQLIDQFTTVVPGETATARKLITINEWFFAGRPADHLTMPRPLLIEALAQTGVAAVLSLPEHAGDNVLFGGIQEAAFLKDIVPGDALTLTVTMTKLKRRIGLSHGEITRQGTVVVTADLIFAITAKE
ncbi:3-hydroxyacyl-ACP dehydratase FabZ family protein [Schleiferilactobacillus perolens]|jgi:3-hydroxyacyl-[acyl-carrier-protein] dehydratase|uniref:(3R)-hydroxymyristoyl-ACP dehydratase n=1 Tax=Schleiferilactobacillus perolens DSM 12744 TaxID=1423792 RepID=A0A0R1MT21_9LACO|nr:3-hydroxyacyl-ACP dehydratase FabZ family protein [Schleiferilactobacillus perolens]KRL11121.1 (3R)-hydroxymyristoyl-ACP dehydratase [Schleiferilactobacillus perolens DSM 12744]MCI1891515.1 beta-hydroxyacyl-ACP dehydratase [Schleiferilactobacillus harbinensis]MCI1911931.1 beta-hydroxyacyl-ACP dehydratase [Schleiferilactobacillus harbinensis]MCI2170511.1 beta-hydroxyacyl-ACP dehydratase [Schleiferilactobacillus perolens]